MVFLGTVLRVISDLLHTKNVFVINIVRTGIISYEQEVIGSIKEEILSLLPINYSFVFVRRKLMNTFSDLYCFFQLFHVL